MRVRAIALTIATVAVLGSGAACGATKPSGGAAPGAAQQLPADTASPIGDEPAALTPPGAVPSAVEPSTSSPSVTPTAKIRRTKTPAPVRRVTRSPAPRPSVAPPARAPKPTGALAFTTKTVAGTSFDGASLAGKPSVLWFWTPWCPACHGQVADVVKVAATYGGKVNVVGVAGLDRAGPIKEFVAEKKLTFTNLADTSGTVWKHFGVKQQAYYVLIDAKGKITYTGYIPNNRLAERVRALGG